MTHRPPPRTPAGPCLRDPGWTPRTRAWLEDLLRQDAGRGLPVAFDFDNTLVCGDVGEATLARLVQKRRLKPAAIASLAPPFRTTGGRRISLRTLPDLTAYYEALLEGTGHGSEDPNPYTLGYTWAVQIMAGLTPAEVVRATAAVATRARVGEERLIEVTRGTTAYPVPWFHPPMVELVAALLGRGFQVWIVSASNAWSVRWMVRQRLNPALAALGCRSGVPPAHVIGVAPLLRDPSGALLKDRVLVRTDPTYARLDPRRLARLQLTDRLDLPAPVYSGKVACLWDALGRAPHFAAGDSPGDLPMLAFATHRLWLARLDKPGYSRAMREERARARSGSWAVQPVLTRGRPGFVPQPAELDLPALPAPEPTRQTLALLRDLEA